jgi:hypothetical protein
LVYCGKKNLATLVDTWPPVHDVLEFGLAVVSVVNAAGQVLDGDLEPVEGRPPRTAPVDGEACQSGSKNAVWIFVAKKFQFCNLFWKALKRKVLVDLKGIRYLYLLVIFYIL